MLCVSCFTARMSGIGWGVLLIDVLQNEGREPQVGPSTSMCPQVLGDVGLGAKSKPGRRVGRLWEWSRGGKGNARNRFVTRRKGR